MRRASGALAVLCGLFLSGCMTQQNTATFTESFLSGLANGMLTGAAVNVGQGLAMDNGRLVRAGLAQMAAGTLAQGGAAAIRQSMAQQRIMQAQREFADRAARAAASRGMRGGSGSTAVPLGRLDPHTLPNTPECRRLAHLMRTARSERQLAALKAADEACTRSARRARGKIPLYDCRTPDGRPGKRYSNPYGGSFCVPLWQPGDPMPKNAIVLR